MDVGCRNALRGGKGWRPPEVHLAKPAARSSLAGREGEGVEGKHEGGGGGDEAASKSKGRYDEKKSTQSFQSGFKPSPWKIRKRMKDPPKIEIICKKRKEGYSSWNRQLSPKESRYFVKRGKTQLYCPHQREPRREI